MSGADQPGRAPHHAHLTRRHSISVIEWGQPLEQRGLVVGRDGVVGGIEPPAWLVVAPDGGFGVAGLVGGALALDQRAVSPADGVGGLVPGGDADGVALVVVGHLVGGLGPDVEGTPSA